MTWEPFKPAATANLKAGEASLDSRGRLTMRDEDLERAGIMGKRVAVDMDRESRRVMLREPASRAQPAISITTANTKRTRTSKIHLLPAVRAMGLVINGPARCMVDVIEHGNGRAMIVHLPLERAKLRAKPIERAGGAS